MDYIKFNGHILPFNSYSEIAEAKSSPFDLQNVCISPDNCVLISCLQHSCPSVPCLSNKDCGSPSKDDFWCICLRNMSGSSCAPCSSYTMASQSCSQFQKSAPLWIVAVVLPIALVLLVLVLCIVIKRQGKLCNDQKASHAFLMPPANPHGTDNLAFNGVDEIPQNIWNDGCHQPDLIRPKDRTRGLESYSNGGPPCPISCYGGSELEYYEIDSTYTVYSSDVITQTHDKPGIDPERLNGNQQISACSTNQVLPSPKLRGDFHHWERQSHTFFRPNLPPDVTGPPQHLSKDEVEKLNAKWERKGDFLVKPCRAVWSGGCMETSSESESHYSFTGSEFDYCERELSLISSQDNKDEHPSEGKCIHKKVTQFF